MILFKITDTWVGVNTIYIRKHCPHRSGSALSREYSSMTAFLNAILWSKSYVFGSSFYVHDTLNKDATRYPERLFNIKSNRPCVKLKKDKFTCRRLLFVGFAAVKNSSSIFLNTWRRFTKNKKGATGNVCFPLWLKLSTIDDCQIAKGSKTKLTTWL